MAPRKDQMRIIRQDAGFSAKLGFGGMVAPPAEVERPSAMPSAPVCSRPESKPEQPAIVTAAAHVMPQCDDDCGFRAIGAVISRDRGRLFHGIAGSHFAVAGRLIDGFMESGLMAEVKGFRDFSAHAFA